MFLPSTTLLTRPTPGMGTGEPRGTAASIVGVENPDLRSGVPERELERLWRPPLPPPTLSASVMYSTSVLCSMADAMATAPAEDEAALPSDIDERSDGGRTDDVGREGAWAKCAAGRYPPSLSGSARTRGAGAAAASSEPAVEVAADAMRSACMCLAIMVESSSVARQESLFLPLALAGDAGGDAMLALPRTDKATAEWTTAC